MHATDLRVQALVDQLLGFPEKLAAEHRNARCAVSDLVVLGLHGYKRANRTRREKNTACYEWSLEKARRGRRTWMRDA